MNKILKRISVILLLLALSLSACGMDGTPFDPACLESPAPWAVEPIDRAYYTVGDPGVQLPLRWLYNGSCMPTRFKILVNDVPLKQDYPLFETFVDAAPMPPSVVAEDGSTAYGYSAEPEQLFQAGMYWWWVIPYYGEYRGQGSELNQISVFTQTTSSTVPYCMPAFLDDIAPAELVYPGRGQVVHTLHPTLVWRDNNPQQIGCLDYSLTDYVIFYSYDPDLVQSFDIIGLLESQPYTLWSYDLDAGLWNYDQERYRLQIPDYWVLPEGLFMVTDHAARSITLDLYECRRVHWRLYTYWQVRPDESPGDFIYAGYSYFDIDPDACGTEGLLPPEPFPSPTEDAGILPLYPTALVLKNANCRSGPTTDYPVRRVLLPGEQYPVVGRSRDGIYWVIALLAIDDDIAWTPDDIRANGCWVFGENVQVSGDAGLVHLIDPDPPHLVLPPTDTPTLVPAPFNCAQYNDDFKACQASPYCKWDPNGSPNSPCVNK